MKDSLEPNSKLPKRILFSVIVPTCERPEDLKRCLERLSPGFQTFGHSRYEVLVSDDGSSRESQRMVAERFPWVVWLQGPRRGPAANRNHAAGSAGGKWLVFVDDDCLPEAGLLEGYAQAITAFPGVHVFEGKTVPCGNRQRLDDRCPENQTGGKLWSCNFAIEAESFFGIGRFDGSFPFPAFEDIEFNIRLQKSGMKIVFCPEAVVFHPWKKDRGFKFWLHAVDSLVHLLNKHPDQKKHHTFKINCKLCAGKLCRQFIPEVIALQGKGALKEFCLSLWIVTLKIVKINIVNKFRH